MSAKISVAQRVVQYHPPVGLSTLFRPLPKDGVRPTLAVTYQPLSGGPVLTFSAKSALGIPEQTLLLALLELAQEQLASFHCEAVLNANADSVVGRELWTRLNRGDPSATGQTLKLNTTWHELNRRCNVATGGPTQGLRAEQLKRLCEVVVWETSVGEKMTIRQSYLVAWLVGDDSRIHLALNCGLASALLGQPYAQVSLTERLKLGRDIPMALHAFLSTTLTYGNHLKIKVETLLERLWPGSAESAPKGTHRRRRKDISDGLELLGRLNTWTVEWETSDMACVTRLSFGVRDMTGHKANKNRAYPEQTFAKITSKINDLRPFDASGLFFNTNTSA